MLKKKLKELLTMLTVEQQHSLYQNIIQLRTDKLKLEKMEIPQQNDIAIIGLSGYYPKSNNHYEFWHRLQKGENFIQEVPASRWYHGEYYDPNINKSFIPHKTRCKFGAFLNAYDKFDASFFGLNNSNEVLLMDPQERLALETTWSCIEDAGYTPTKLGKDVGIFSGITYSEYQKLIPFTCHSYMLNCRIAYFFNFQGPSITIDAGCCSSLTAIHLASQSLIRKECRTAIVIGANIILHPDHYTSSSSMHSPTIKPYSNPFGTDDGWIPAEGVVSVILKPLKQALKENDHIYAVIKASRIYQEGKTSWFTAFNPKRQSKLIKDNFDNSWIHPETISYIEAAANGSSLGDAIELEGLITAFNHFTNKKQFCPLGTVKSNVGHGEAVSTLLQLTKVLLQFKSKKLVPLINLNEINPNISIKNSPFYFQTSTTNWKTPIIKINNKNFIMPRRAAISSFGAGGNIGHLILEEHVDENIKKQTLDSYFIPLSSKTIDQLQQIIKNHIKFIEEYLKIDSEWESNYTLLNIMYTLCVGRVHFKERIVFIANNFKTLIKLFYKYLSSENDPNIISNIQTSMIKIISEKNQAKVQSYLENCSWHDLAKLWSQGINIHWETFFNSFKVKRVPLPTYCFQKRSFTIPKPTHYKQITDNIINALDGIDKKENKIIKYESQGSNDILEKQNYYDESKFVRIIINIFSKVIGIPLNQIDLSTPLEVYGFNSAMVIKITNELETYFNVVPKTLFFECQNIKDIINFFIKECPVDIENINSKENIMTLSKYSTNDSLDNQHVCNSEKSIETEIDNLINDLADAILSENPSDKIDFEKLLKVSE